MCGRFSLGVDTDALIAEFGLAEVTEAHAPRYNVAPTQPVGAVVAGPGGLRLGLLRWGLEAGRHGASPRRPLINARAETVASRPAFADSFRRRRCWILADGFYEWRREPGGARTPFHIARSDGRPFAFAGIWTRGTDPEQPVPTCAIITTTPAPAVAGVHDRMPVILPEDRRAEWLDPSAPADRLARLLRPFDGPLAVHPVSTRVNAVAHDDPACRQPLPLPPETSVP